MATFPLYNTLANNLPTKDLTIKQKKDLVNQIETFGHEEMKLVYALIRSYYLDKDNGDVLSIPYSGTLNKNKQGQSKITFDLLSFPKQLRQLLYKFVTVHEKRLEEEQHIKALQEN